MKPDMVEPNSAKPIFYLFFIVCLLWIQVESVDAHGIHLFARVEGDTVYVESDFSGGKGVKAAKIIVLNSEGTELLSGTTDENGEFSFKVPQTAQLKIVLEDDAGHRAERTIEVNEIEVPAAGKKQKPQKDNTIGGIIIGLGGIFFLTAIVAYIRMRQKIN